MPAQARSVPPPSSSADRRTHPRTTVMREGQAFRPDGLAAAVLIVDMSEGGARLRIRGGQIVPDDFVLADSLTFLAHRAAVVWRRDAEVGVRLLRAQSLRGLVPAALHPAKAFCERAGR